MQLKGNLARLNVTVNAFPGAGWLPLARVAQRFPLPEFLELVRGGIGREIAFHIINIELTGLAESHGSAPEKESGWAAARGKGSPSVKPAPGCSERTKTERSLDDSAPFQTELNGWLRSAACSGWASLTQNA
jgi:hypothetical protein